MGPTDDQVGNPRVIPIGASRNLAARAQDDDPHRRDEPQALSRGLHEENILESIRFDRRSLGVQPHPGAPGGIPLRRTQHLRDPAWRDDLIPLIVPVGGQHFTEADPVALPCEKTAVGVRSTPGAVQPQPSVGRAELAPQFDGEVIRVPLPGSALDH